MNKYLVGIVIAGVVVVAGGAAALYSNINSKDTTEKVIYYSEAQKMHYPEIELGRQNEKEAADDEQDQETMEADKDAGNSNTGFTTADNPKPSAAPSDSTQSSQQQATQTVTNNPKPSVTSSDSTQSSQQPASQQAMGNPKPSGSTQNSPQPATQKPAETEKTTEAVWVVDVPAWTEEYPVYDYVQIAVCSGCGADISGHAWEHVGADPYDECGGYHSEIKEIYVGTETIYHEEEGHYEYR